MPNLQLEPAAAADIGAYLLDATGDYQPDPLPKLIEADLNELGVLHRAKQVGGEELPPLGEMTCEEKLQYVGRRTIGKRGCFGCHDIRGFENAQPIGPALSDWGRKRESLLAFGQVHGLLDKEPESEDDGFFREALLAHRREGFLWQKLRAPRSFNYRATEGIGYNERLTMGRFTLDEQQREAVMTFVLGLVADPPTEKYVYQPDRTTRAIIEGRKVLDKYACAECHTLEMQRWTLQLDPDEFEPPPQSEDHDFLRPDVSPEAIDASLETDARGLVRAEVVGMPQIDQEGQLAIADEDVDEQDNDIFQYAFSLWEPAAVAGTACGVGGADLLVWDYEITKKRPALGGRFARLLYPTVLADARETGSQAAGAEARGWVPPSLVGEGAKVRPAWLHDYLLNPRLIRPACVPRMPRYNMSPDEAAKLVDYFAATAGVDFPYTTEPTLLVGGPVPQRMRGFERAMKMMVDRQTYCAKCHLIGDFSPGGEVRTVLAPDLAQVSDRIRPEYVRRWLANPKSVLPYTGMPVNFPADGRSVDPERFPGNSRGQLDAMADFLLNYDWFMRNRTSIRRMVEPADGPELTDEMEATGANHEE